MSWRSVSRSGPPWAWPETAGAPASAAGQAELLRALTEDGLPVRMRVHGFSMTPFIRDDDVVTIAPLGGSGPCVGEVVAFTLPEGGKLVLHRVISRERAGWLVRGDNRSESDGIVPGAHILGRVTRVERRGRDIAFGMGSTGAGVAWMSRTGGLHGLVGLHKSLRRVASFALLHAQRLPHYRIIARHLVGRVEVEEADQAGNVAVRLRNSTAGAQSQELRTHGVVSTWVAKRRGRVVGWVELVNVEEPDSPWVGQWLSWVAVRIPFRGRGVGEALGSRAIAKASNGADPFLSVAVFEDNEPAIGLFEKLGFARVAPASLEPALEAEMELLGRRSIAMRMRFESWAEAQFLGAELRVLLLCARAVLEPRRLPAFYAALTGCSDAGLLCEAAVEQGMVGHLHRAVADWASVVGPSSRSGGATDEAVARPEIPPASP